MAQDKQLTVEQGAMHDLYSNHFGWLKSWLYKRVSCPELAADLAQDTFVRLLPKPEAVNSVASPRSYLSTIASRLCTDMWRRRAVEKAWLETLEQQPEPVQISPQDHAIIIETICEIDEMLARLPQKVATAFILSQFDGLTYKQIAAHLDVSERMVKKYIAQALLACVVIEADYHSQSHID